MASALGLAIGLATFSLEHFGWIEDLLIPLLLPGVLGSMVLAANVHAFSLWIAAIINAVFYFTMVWLIGAVFTTLQRKFRRAE